MQSANDVQLVELTAFPFDAAAAAFGAFASAEERRRAHRLPPSRARVFVHARGALHLVTPAPHRSWSYAGGRAWAASCPSPIGLDVVAAAELPALDVLCVDLDDERACTGFGFPARLVAWAAKEATAKLTGEIDREPAWWRLRRSDQGELRAEPGATIMLRFIRPAPGLLAAVACRSDDDPR